MTYKILGRPGIDRLVPEVNDHLSRGWKLEGGVSAVCENNHSWMYYQAVSMSSIKPETSHIDVEEIYRQLKSHGGKWKTFRNPMRQDGLFVGQETFDFEKQTGGKCFEYQLPPDVARDLIARLNA